MDKMITVFKLPADGSLKTIPEEIPDNLTQLQHYVDGYIEIVTLDRQFGILKDRSLYTDTDE